MSIAQIFARIVLIVAVFAVACTSARSVHFGDSTQENAEGEVPAYETNLPSNKEYELMNQRLALLNAMAAQYPNWDRVNFSPEKRANRMRCYFNPVSCYKKK